MADFLGDRVFDNGLTVLDTEADKLYITSAQAATLAEATTTYALGNKTLAAGVISAVGPQPSFFAGEHHLEAVAWAAQDVSDQELTAPDFAGRQQCSEHRFQSRQQLGTNSFTGDLALFGCRSCDLIEVDHCGSSCTSPACPWGSWLLAIHTDSSNKQ